jgi:hypothetical protein
MIIILSDFLRSKILSQSSFHFASLEISQSYHLDYNFSFVAAGYRQKTICISSSYLIYKEDTQQAG